MLNRRHAKDNLYKLIILLHIVCTAFISNYLSVREIFNHNKKKVETKRLDALVAVLARDYPLAFYTSVSGIKTGYGFFAPDVAFAGFMVVKANNKLYYPKFISKENGIRFENVLEHVMVKSSADPSEKVDSARLKFYDFVTFHIGRSILQSHHVKSDKFTFYYYNITIPRNGRDFKMTLQPVKQKTYWGDKYQYL